MNKTLRGAGTHWSVQHVRKSGLVVNSIHLPLTIKQEQWSRGCRGGWGILNKSKRQTCSFKRSCTCTPRISDLPRVLRSKLWSRVLFTASYLDPSRLQINARSKLSNQKNPIFFSLKNTSGMLFIIDIVWKPQFFKHFIFLKSCPFFDC